MQHGGNLDEAERLYGIKTSEIKDFSGNINPLAPPERIINSIIDNVTAITRYPDAKYLKLRQAIGNYTGVSADNIIVGNGSTELISLVMNLYSGKKALIISPAYSEYERAVSNNGGTFVLFPLLEEDNFRLNLNNLLPILSEEINLLVICNPNNPTGTAIPLEDLETIINRCKENNIFVMIDETYAEFSEDVSACPLIEKHKNLFIIRGTSKFFGVPGLRLGYGLCSDEKVLETAEKVKDPWSVSTLSTLAGESMFKDTQFINKTKTFIAQQREKICSALEKISSVKYYESYSNFILIKILNPTLNAQILFDLLIKEGILIRNADSFPFLDNSFFRICIGTEKDNELLIEKLQSILNKVH